MFQPCPHIVLQANLSGGIKGSLSLMRPVHQNTRVMLSRFLPCEKSGSRSEIEEFCIGGLPKRRQHGRLVAPLVQGCGASFGQIYPKSMRAPRCRGLVSVPSSRGRPVRRAFRDSIDDQLTVPHTLPLVPFAVLPKEGEGPHYDILAAPGGGGRGRINAAGMKRQARASTQATTVRRWKPTAKCRILPRNQQPSGRKQCGSTTK